MVTVDTSKCQACSVCVDICHEHSMSIVNGAVAIDYELCSTCTQCIAACPQRALSWNHVPPLAYERERLPSAEQLDELFKQRRTVREFKPDKIDPKLLEDIVGYGAYAPTHSHSFRTIVVADDRLIELIDTVVLRFCRGLYHFIFKAKLVHNLIRAIAPAWEPELRLARPKLEKALQLGSALGSPPAAIVFIVGDWHTALSEASAQYALYNMNLYAMANGVSGRNLVGNQMVFNRSKVLRKRLQLRRHERVFGTLGLGYAAVKFRNKVEGRSMEIQWLDRIT